MFSLIGIGERLGSGIVTVISIAKEPGLPTPLFEESYQPDRTTVDLFIK